MRIIKDVLMIIVLILHHIVFANVHDSHDHKDTLNNPYFY